MEKDVGKIGEDYIAYLCEKPFLADFLFPSPKYSRGGQQKELCDLLLFFEDVLIVFQIKTQDPRIQVTRRDEDELRWADKKEAEALKQVKGAFRTIQQGRLLQLTNARQGTLEFDHRRCRHFFGVTVVHRRPVPRSSRPPEELRGVRCPTLCVNFEELERMFAELSTTGDFVDYLQARTRFFENQELDKLSELDLLAAYKPDPHAFNAHLDSRRPMNVYSGAWRKYETLEELQKRDAADKPSRLVDAIINSLHESQGIQLPHLEEWRAQYGEAVSVNQNYVQVASKLARLRRLDRRILANKLIEKRELCIKQGRDRWCGGLLASDPDVGYVFLISTTSRAARCKTLFNLILAAKLKHDFREMIGIVTEPVTAEGSSVDALRMEFDNSTIRDQVPDELMRAAEKWFQGPTWPEDREFSG